MLLTPAMMLASQPAPTAAILEQNQANTSPREKGIVKFYDPKRKYGIATLDDGREIFITHSSLSNSYIPVENDTIEFEVNVTIRSSGSEKLETKNITCIQSSLIESNKSTIPILPPQRTLQPKISIFLYQLTTLALFKPPMLQTTLNLIPHLLRKSIHLALFKPLQM
jgi:cold shock CspA family protein